ncbi:hypothetical protein DPMN_121507 [Dreissena polymorpha]|uniref:Uncharacterized protein n=1 Tax=Dreissena polymorpha TaxID=45954 RepID=A0A9D4GQ77_DREPO|nr:hypothetical protein DPMN_121414 [Dreissena polymorpha]KAH3819763.1 hypothetical protein DPMN_121507 [Dreissena polymorpha]
MSSGIAHYQDIPLRLCAQITDSKMSTGNTYFNSSINGHQTWNGFLIYCKKVLHSLAENPSQSNPPSIRTHILQNWPCGFYMAG